MKFLKHYPSGVVFLSSIECFERFGFYATQGILVLYAAASLAKGGLGWSNADALRLTGVFSALVYGTPIIGGWLSDKWIGRKNGLILGNIILMLGYLTMMRQGTAYLFTALSLIAIGTGFLKPTISAMIGEFYKPGEDANRDSGFAIFYASINIGGFLGPLVSGVLAESFGYSFAFGSSAIGMSIALINTLIACKLSLHDVGNRVVMHTHHNKPIKEKWTADETRRFWIYIVLCVSNIVWNIFYTLPYGLLNLWANNNIDREIFGWLIPGPWFYASYAFLIVIFSPIIAKIYNTLKKHHVDYTLSYKLATAYLLMGIGFVILMPFIFQLANDSAFKGNMFYLVIFYILFAFSELLTIPVLLSAATKFAPRNFSSTMVALNMLISWCIGAYIGGEVAALAESFNPRVVFIDMTIACAVCFFGHIITNKFIEKVSVVSGHG